MAAVGSYDKLDYSLRPSKQVERKLFIETFHRLAQVGYPLSDYSYLGFGSVSYIDFILFHKYLFIDKMRCVEHGPIPRRMRFNKPFSCIKLRMQPMSSVIPTISRSKPHLVWLDYDYGLNSTILEDIDSCIRALSQKSILIITVDAERRLPDGTKLRNDEDDAELRRYFWKELGSLLSKQLSDTDVERRVLPKLFARTIRTQVQKSLLSRPEATFHQLFNYQYDDGSQMLTIGGIIDRKEAAGELRDSGIYDLAHIRRGEAPLLISVPPLTTREKQWLDRYIHYPQRHQAIPFELRREHFLNYKRYYRHYPVYHEALI